MYYYTYLIKCKLTKKNEFLKAFILKRYINWLTEQ